MSFLELFQQPETTGTNKLHSDVLHSFPISAASMHRPLLP